ncbi:serine palmitoyltransferase 1 [Syncephalis pseudoplumigaleata]|uniref:serine C-palmitoyltransferase n=1 Tax=Syncephalis pseudoplumigaleata TaxID=1712513 RepID=A0A4P9Z549_9FUNG|nr:serine palmitoyltransferase 1 [Syncephalis pseudoplumigaleata]|eukprot:RKP27202.1 serine palmitoyltransferase 1 [Syncephalis pseudoplumigaleata]
MTLLAPLLEFIHQVNAILVVLVSWVSMIPGSSIVFRYIRNSYQNDPVRIVLELFLVFFAIRYMVQSSYSINHRTLELSEKEVDELVGEWEPEPLVPLVSAKKRRDLDTTHVIVGANGPCVEVQGKGSQINLALFDFMGLLGDQAIKDESKRILRTYGVGTCGPAGFYGTIDLHQQLEKDLAAFFGAEAAIIYAQGFSTVVSLIPAFSKRGDIIICDDGAAFTIQRGIQLSRSHVKYYKHNDMADLERVLKEVDAEERKKKRPLTRRFIIAEGLSQNYGDIAPLPDLIRLKKQYKYRLILDESLSVGVLGKHGRGLTEHFNVPASDVDMLAGNMANSLCSAGGFCAGSIEIIDHQRLGATAYCFSASLPAIMAKSVILALQRAQSEPERFERLSANIQAFRAAFGDSSYFDIVGDMQSPVMHMRMRQTSSIADRSEQNDILFSIEDKMSEHGFLVRRALYVEAQERALPAPSLRLCVTAGHTTEQLTSAARALREISDTQMQQALDGRA